MQSFSSWSNQTLRLYHGTTRSRAEAIVIQIDPGKGRSHTDFGTGFYTTSWLPQAISWAKIVATTAHDDAVVVAFDVDRLQLSNLASLYFVRGARDAHDFWSLVNHCRSGGCHYSGTSWYDVVVGPVAASWSGRRIHHKYDQISFHSKIATRILDVSTKEIIDVV